MALILSDRLEDAQKLLRKIAPPATPGVPVDPYAKDAASRCVSLLWALALHSDEPSMRAANLRVFLKEKPTSQEREISADTLAQLFRRAKEALPKVGQPCSDLSHFSSVVALFGQEAKAIVGKQ